MSIKSIKQKLEKAFPGAKIELFNTASQHIGHNSGLHLKTIIKFEGFNGKTLIEQHKMIQESLKEELGKEIHALSIETKNG